MIKALSYQSQISFNGRTLKADKAFRGVFSELGEANFSGRKSVFANSKSETKIDYFDRRTKGGDDDEPPPPPPPPSEEEPAKQPWWTYNND